MTPAVLVAMLGSVLAQESRQAPTSLLAALDTNRDGQLDADELRAASASLAKLDRNGDGKLAGAELAGDAPRRGRGNRVSVEDAVAELARQNRPLAKDDAERRVLEAFEEARRGQRYANVSMADGRLLRQLVEVADAKKVVEVGTSTGESAIWLALGLRATGGKLVTHELDEGRARVARENFEEAGVADLITIVMGDAHETVKQHEAPIDLIFLDADKPGYVDYLEKLLPLVRPGGLVVAHNMRSPRPDPAYITAITSDPKLETSFLLMEGSGLGVTLKKR